MIFSPTDSCPGERLHPDQLAQLADDIRQLTAPWSRIVWQERTYWWWDHNRNRKKRTRRWSTTLWYPGLLNQLRAATTHRHPGGNRPERRQIPGSAPPGNLAALDALAEMYVALSGWHAALGLPSPPPDTDWQHYALRQLVGAAAQLPRHDGERLVADVHRWWRRAAVQAGWNPRELLDERGAS